MVHQMKQCNVMTAYLTADSTAVSSLEYRKMLKISVLIYEI